jgi:hypothetical protein
MTKRVNRLPSDTSLGFTHPITKKLIQKRFTWKCSVCGSEFPFQWQAKECEDQHLLDNFAKSKGFNDFNEMREIKEKELKC